jgi:hypothetical protein
MQKLSCIDTQFTTFVVPDQDPRVQAVFPKDMARNAQRRAQNKARNSSSNR